MQRANAERYQVEGIGSFSLQMVETVNIDGKHFTAQGRDAFYEGIDDNGNMVRVPASAIAAHLQRHRGKRTELRDEEDIDAIAKCG